MAMAHGEADTYVPAVTETAVEPEPATPAVVAEIAPLVPTRVITASFSVRRWLSSYGASKRQRPARPGW